ncbi:MerR family transcriptional regulator [uncultured Roseovarius sp.]|uniref:MerR family transcriptional regulator n=1 Tax=uncultured Roseovarius sp. TaxID=293344 RepID=UPI0025F8407D|nr:MerR family transcriptional regulator [uncultured Roseovarius sp.]
MPKSADAFRTISEVADWLETPAHVLRFWESKFSQVKPVKRAGGRRYYRPTDMLLLGGIKKLLHDDGMTIKGVQKILREQGVKHVSAMSQPLEEGLEVDGASSGITLDAEPAPPDSATVVNFKSSSAKSEIAEPTAELKDEPEYSDDGDPIAKPDQAPDTLAGIGEDTLPEAAPATLDDTTPEQAPDTLAGGAPEGVEDTVLNALADADETPTESEAPEEPQAPVMPSFLRHREAESDSADETTPAAEEEAPQVDTPEDDVPAAAPAQVEVPEDPTDDINADPGLLSQLLSRKDGFDPSMAKELAPLMERLRALHDGARSAG